jgi:PKD repeat protein
MKRKITKLKEVSRHILSFLATSAIVLFTNNATAQLTNPAPYCAPVYTNMPTGPCSNNWNVRLGSIDFGALQYDESVVCPTTVTSNYRYFPQNIITSARTQPGNSYSMNIRSTSAGTFTRSVGVWIDWNKNNEFDANEYLDQGTNVGNAVNPGAGIVYRRDFNVPCGTQPGTYRMRVRLIGNGTISAGQPCASVLYGETWDFDLIVEPLAAIPSPDFLIPNNIFVGTPVTFINSTPGVDRSNFSFGFQWDLDNNGIVNASSTNFQTVFNSAGIRALKLKIPGCGQADSITKTFNVMNPAVAPTVDFYATSNMIEDGDEVMLVDLSGNGPTSWNWLLQHTTLGIAYDNNDANGFAGFGGRENRAIFELYDIGFFNVTLTAGNSQGVRNRTKNSYIQVQEFSLFGLGDGRTNTDLGKGTIFSRNFPGLYPTNVNGSGNNNRLRISPCGAEKIYLHVDRLMLGGSVENLKVWDGPNPVFGTPLHPPAGFTRNNTNVPFTVVATSGRIYLEFNTEGGVADSGLIARFETDYGVVGSPMASFEIANGQTEAYTNARTIIKSTSSGIFGEPSYSWTIDGSPVLPSEYTDLEGIGTEFAHVFTSAGTYQVCLDIEACTGTTNGCQTITVVDPTSQTDIDFEASDIRPNAFENIDIVSSTDKANVFFWEINPPGSFQFEGGTSPTSPNIRGNFTQTGSYTVSLRAYNSSFQTITDTTLVKEDYVIVVRYCTPTTQIVSGDVGFRNLRVNDNRNGNMIFNLNSGTGSIPYEDFTSDRNFFIPMYIGGSYRLNLSRASTVNPVNHAVYIDYNSDGEFTMDERVLFVNNSTQAIVSGSFTVPNMDNLYSEAPVRMRVVTSLANEDPLPCGPLLVGEFEDYLVSFMPFTELPVITLDGADTIRLEQGFPYDEPGYTAIDNLEGDITAWVTISSDLDNSQIGTYHITYDVMNSSNVSAEQRVRVVQVVLDNTPPVLTLAGNNPDTIDVFQPYSEPGYTSVDAQDGNITSFVVIDNALNTDVLGSYAITYTSTDMAGNVSQEVRTVVVVDRVAPVINLIGSDSVEFGRFWTDPTTVTDNYWSMENIQFTKQFGLTGQVRWDRKGVYTVNYTAIDGSGNTSTASRTFIVDDYIPPVILLNTSDTILHDVNTNYNSTAPTISDNSYSLSEIAVVTTTNLNVNVLGIYSETFTATDGSGNIAQATRWIRVVDRVAPVITAPSICTKLGMDYNPMNTIVVTDNYYSNDILIDLVEVVSSNVNPFNVGNYTASFRVTDPSGNQSRVAVQSVRISADCELITSVDNPEVKMLSVYPNPTTGILYLNNITNAVINQVKVYDNIGNVVIDMDAKNLGNAVTEINISEFANGVYHINVYSENGFESHKIILTK